MAAPDRPAAHTAPSDEPNNLIPFGIQDAVYTSTQLEKRPFGHWKCSANSENQCALLLWFSQGSHNASLGRKEKGREGEREGGQPLG